MHRSLDQLVLASGAVIALARRDERARSVLRAALEGDVEVFVPAVVLAETAWAQPNDATINQVVKAVGRVLSVNETTGRMAGALLQQANSSSTIDSLVVASTIEAGGGTILTGDPDDLAALAGKHPTVQIQPL